MRTGPLATQASEGTWSVTAGTRFHVLEVFQVHTRLTGGDNVLERGLLGGEASLHSHRDSNTGTSQGARFGDLVRSRHMQRLRGQLQNLLGANPPTDIRPSMTGGMPRIRQATNQEITRGYLARGLEEVWLRNESIPRRGMLDNMFDRNLVSQSERAQTMLELHSSQQGPPLENISIPRGGGEEQVWGEGARRRYLAAGRPTSLPSFLLEIRNWEAKHGRWSTTQRIGKKIGTETQTPEIGEKLWVSAFLRTLHLRTALTRWQKNLLGSWHTSTLFLATAKKSWMQEMKSRLITLQAGDSWARTGVCQPASSTEQERKMAERRSEEWLNHPAWDLWLGARRPVLVSLLWHYLGNSWGMRLLEKAAIAKSPTLQSRYNSMLCCTIDRSLVLRDRAPRLLSNEWVVDWLEGHIWCAQKWYEKSGCGPHLHFHLANRIHQRLRLASRVTQALTPRWGGLRALGTAWIVQFALRLRTEKEGALSAPDTTQRVTGGGEGKGAAMGQHEEHMSSHMKRTLEALQSWRRNSNKAQERQRSETERLRALSQGKREDVVPRSSGQGQADLEANESLGESTTQSAFRQPMQLPA